MDGDVPLKLLAVGDLHLGRRPSRLPEVFSSRAGELGPAAAWRRVVKAAIAHGVDAVALAGDLVEREDDFYEAYRALYDGVTDLAAAGIRVLGVAGNHDVRVLPRLADQISDFYLLGRNGKWESVDLRTDGEHLTLWGWSFPQREARRSPLEGVRFERPDGPSLGLLHCDRDQMDSPYAPVASRELEAAGLDGWLLGHIHVPDELEAPYPTGYLGSVTGMDPGESGSRGPWLVTVEQGRVASVEQWVLAPLRWERLSLNLTGIEEPVTVQDLLLEELRSLDRKLAKRHQPPEAVGLRLRLIGRTRFGEDAEAALGEELRELVPLGGSEIHYFIERLILDTRPEISLQELATRDDPPGLLARRLQCLEGAADNDQRRALIAEGRERLRARVRDARWQALGAQELDDKAVADWLCQAATRLLERMLAQRGEGT